jgi:hypothetical protein
MTIVGTEIVVTGFPEAVCGVGAGKSIRRIVPFVEIHKSFMIVPYCECMRMARQVHPDEGSRLMRTRVAILP